MLKIKRGHCAHQTHARPVYPVSNSPIIKDCNIMTYTQDDVSVHCGIQSTNIILCVLAYVRIAYNCLRGLTTHTHRRGVRRDDETHRGSSAASGRNDFSTTVLSFYSIRARRVLLNNVKYNVRFGRFTWMTWSGRADVAPRFHPVSAYAV